MKMSFIEFYEKWCVDIASDGTSVPVRPLTDEERLILNTADELGVAPYVRIMKRRRGTEWIVHPEVEAKIKNDE